MCSVVLQMRDLLKNVNFKREFVMKEINLQQLFSVFFFGGGGRGRIRK